MDVEKQKNSEKRQRTVMDIGALLVESRENKSLSAQDIATHLNLTLSVITNIEANQFKQDIPLPFIRGYLRSYAKRVNADVETLSVEFDRQTKTVDEPIQKIQVVSSFKSSRKELNSSNFIFKTFTLLVIISLLGFAGWEAWKKYGEPKFNNETEANGIELTLIEGGLEPSTSTSSEQLNQIEITDSENNEGSEYTQNDSSALLDDTNNQDDLLVDDIEEPISNINTNSNLLSLNSDADTESASLSATFTFTDKCWVKVVDASGEVLAVGEKVAGKVMPLVGIAPFTVVLGDPGAVKLTVNGESYDLSSFRAGRSANFELTF